MLTLELVANTGDNGPGVAQGIHEEAELWYNRSETERADRR